MSPVNLQRLSLAASLIGTLASSTLVSAEGTAAQFAGVERWHVAADLTVDIHLLGANKHREKSVKFTLEKHTVKGSIETWEATLKGDDSDQDSAGVLSGDIAGSGKKTVRLVLDTDTDVAKLEVHTEAGSYKMTMKAFGKTLESMKVPQPARDSTSEERIPEEADKVVFSSDTGAASGVHVTQVVTLTPDDVPLKAVLSAGSAVRGMTATLDASQSKGRIKTFKWTLQPTGTSGAPSVTVQTRERTVSLVLLEDVHVDLEVSNGRKQASTSGTAKVIPRKWKTTFAQEAQDGLLDREQLVSPEAVELAQNLFGQDACAFEGRDSAHGMHATHPGTWNDDPSAGYTTLVVHDPERPFDNYWYVKDQSLIVRRRALFNPDISAGSSLFAQNAMHGTAEPFARLVASTRAHEYMHGKLLQRELLKDDPARRIEPLVKPSADKLATFADMEIRATETRMQEGAFHEKDVRHAMRQGFSEGGTVWVRDGRGGFASWSIASFADKGE